MQYLTRAMLWPYIKDARLKQLIEDDDTILDEAETTATSILFDMLVHKHDVYSVCSNVTNPEYHFFARYIITIMLYMIYERVPDRMTPDRVQRDYDETMRCVRDISAGKRSTILPPFPVDIDGDGTPDTTKFRWGSLQGPRSH
jgi:hypothetical protein